MHTERKTVRTPLLFSGVTLFLLGALAGWLARDLVPQEPWGTGSFWSPAATPGATDVSGAARPGPGAARPGGDREAASREPPDFVPTFESLLQLAGRQVDDGLLTNAVGTLLDASVYARDLAQQDLFQQRLATLTDLLDKKLTAGERFDELDRLLEIITLSHPEIAGNFLKLGSLRMRTGSFESALPPLAQIQNHPRLGAQAREMMRQAEQSEIRPGSGEEIPLRAAGSQYVVDARLDDGATVSLLVDTGAAMTVIDSSTLTRLGYSLAGRREYFATAGGVVDAPVITLGRLSIGNTAINSLAVGALPLPLPVGIDGLLGMNFLRHFEFRIDQDKVVLFLNAASRPPL